MNPPPPPVPVVQEAGPEQNPGNSTTCTRQEVELILRPIVKDLESELKVSFVRREGATSSTSSGTAEDMDVVPVPKAVRNTRLASKESRSGVNPKNETAALPKELSQELHATLTKYTAILIETFRNNTAEVKRKQWCFICEREAIYYCCWNTTYCSEYCQALHWGIHRTQCRRVHVGEVISEAESHADAESGYDSN